MSMDPGHRISLKADATGKFFFPIGIEMDEGENYRQAQAYEVNYLLEEGGQRYQYVMVVSVERVAGFFKNMAANLPEWVSAVMEVPAPEQQSQDMCDIWTSPPIPREKLLEIFHRHLFLFCHDGMVGFGGVNPEENGDELFLDDHKILYYSTSSLGSLQSLFESERIPYMKRLRHFSDLSHIHYSLSRKNQGEDYLKVLESLRDEIGLEWQDSKEY